MWIGKKTDKEHDDLVLLEDYKSTGNLSSLELLYGKYVHLVYGVCIKYFSRRDDSQEAVMDIFEELVIKLRSSNIQVFKAWLYVYVKTFCLQKLREKEKSVDIPGWVDFVADESADKMLALNIENYKKKKDVLNACLDKLPEPQKLAIQLFYFSNKSFSEIATRLAVTNIMAKNFLQSGRKSLKQCLEGNNGS